MDTPVPALSEANRRTSVPGAVKVTTASRSAYWSAFAAVVVALACTVAKLFDVAMVAAVALVGVVFRIANELVAGPFRLKAIPVPVAVD